MLESFKLKNKDFTLIGNNCVCWDIYRRYKVKFNSPTIGLFFWSDDYLNFLEQFPAILKKPIQIIPKSRHIQIENWRKNQQWPIGLLGDNVEIQFSHYTDGLDAIGKWNRRMERINYTNIYCMMFDKYGFNDSHFERWKNLGLNNSLLFVSDSKYTGKNVVYMKEFNDVEGWRDSWARNRLYLNYLNVTNWLNNKPNFIRRNK